jgi:hypothetical protein
MNQRTEILGKSALDLFRAGVRKEHRSRKSELQFVLCPNQQNIAGRDAEGDRSEPATGECTGPLCACPSKGIRSQVSGLRFHFHFQQKQPA